MNLFSDVKRLEVDSGALLGVGMPRDIASFPSRDIADYGLPATSLRKVLLTALLLAYGLAPWHIAR